MVEAKVKDYLSADKVVVFSKSYCPYCQGVKDLLDRLHVPYKAYELDISDDGSEIQNYLYKLTGGNTVPRVFINSEFIGGHDDTVAAHKSGKLAIKLAAVGITI